MKEKQNKRWGLKLLSLLCAFLVWLGVVNVADPLVTNTVEVPVEIINEEILTSNDLTYEIVGKKTATISYEVKTTNAHRIRPSDFRAYADMTEMWSVTGSIPIKVEVLSHGEFLEANPVSRTSTIKIETEPLQKKRFDVQTALLGELDDGYETGEITLSPSYIYVEGPESLIGQISSVGVEINTDGVSGDVDGIAELKYYDANGNKIALSDRIESEYKEVAYKMTILKVKNLTLDFQVSGTVASGYRFTGVSCDVKSVPVVGLKSILASMHTITIPGEYLDITGARSDVIKTINLEQFLPDNVTIAGMKSHEIQVVMSVERLEERNYIIETEDISYEGKQSGLTYDAVQSTISIRVRGLKEDLDSLTIHADKVNIDVSEMEEGNHTVTPQLELDGAFEVMNLPSFVIRVGVPSESGESGESTSAGEGATESPSSSETPESSTAASSSQPAQSTQDAVQAGATEPAAETTSAADQTP